MKVFALTLRAGVLALAAAWGHAAPSDELRALELLHTAAGIGDDDSPARRTEALEALHALPQDVRLDVAVLLAAQERDGKVRAIALEMLRPSARPHEVPVAFDLVIGGLPENGVEAEFASAFVAFVADVHSRTREGTHAILVRIRTAPTEVQALVIEGLREYVHVRTAAALGELMFLSAEIRRALLVPLAKLYLRLPQGPTDTLLRDIRDGLASTDLAVRRESCLALGWLRDDRSVPGLIATLKDREVAPRAAALWALRRISGLSLRNEPEAWLHWLARSEAWWDERAEVCFEVLRRGGPPEVLSALQEIGAQSLNRGRIAREVEAALGIEHPGVVRTACAILERLEDPTAIPALTRLLLVAEPQSVAYAHRALVRLSGVDLPPVYSAWRTWLQES